MIEVQLDDLQRAAVEAGAEVRFSPRGGVHVLDEFISTSMEFIYELHLITGKPFPDLADSAHNNTFGVVFPNVAVVS